MRENLVPKFDVNKLYEKIRGETDSFVENFGKTNEDVEATIKTDDKEISVVSVGGTTQTTTTDNPTEEIKVEEKPGEEKAAGMATEEELAKTEPAVAEKKSKDKKKDKKIKEDVEVIITSPDGTKETDIVATDGGEGVQVTTIDKETGETEEIPVGAEVLPEEEIEEELPVEEKKSTVKPKEVGAKDGGKVTAEGKVPADASNVDNPEAIKALTEQEVLPPVVENPPDTTPPVETAVAAETPKLEVNDELIANLVKELPELADVNIEELKKGIEVEMEHIGTVGGEILTVAKIAKDHILEFPDKSYYTALEQMEHELKETPEEEAAEHAEGGSEGPAVEEIPAGEVPIESKKKVKKEDKKNKKKLKEDIDTIIDAKPILTDALKGIGYDVTEYSIADKEGGEATITVKIKNKTEAAAAEELVAEQPPVETSVAEPEIPAPVEAPVETPAPEIPMESKKNEGKVPKVPTNVDNPDAIQQLTEQEEEGQERKAAILVTVSDEGVADSIIKDHEDKQAYKVKNEQGKFDVMVPLEEKKVIDEKIELVKYLQSQKTLTEKQKKFIEENKHLIK